MATSIKLRSVATGFLQVSCRNLVAKRVGSLESSNRYFNTSSRLCSTEKELVFEELSGDLKGAFIIGFNRPAAKNAFSRKLVASMSEALENIKFNNNARVLILRSLAPGIFCAGADLKERAQMKEHEVGPFVSSVRALISEVQQLPLPVIAALDGAALGGGLELALACDLRVAGDNAKLGLTETKLGIIPGGGGTQNLSRLVGPSRAKELIFTARMINGDEAAQYGLVNNVVKQNVEGDAAYQRALEMAQAIIPQGPIALRMAKQAINRGVETDIQSGYFIEQMCYAQTIPTKDRLEGLRAFKEKRKPQFKGE